MMLLESDCPMDHSVFGSMRFDGVVPAAAAQLRSALALQGVDLQIIDMKAASTHAIPTTALLPGVISDRSRVVTGRGHRRVGHRRYRVLRYIRRLRVKEVRREHRQPGNYPANRPSQLDCVWMSY